MKLTRKMVNKFTLKINYYKTYFICIDDERTLRNANFSIIDITSL